jgi:hypothetical protein
MGNDEVCFSQKDGFTLLPGEKGTLQPIPAALN